jgi:hypothetical protein
MEIYFFHKILGNEQIYFFDLDLNPKGPCGGVWSPPGAYLSAPHTSGPRDVPRCGALSLLQKDAALQGGVQQKPL